MMKEIGMRLAWCAAIVTILAPLKSFGAQVSQPVPADLTALLTKVNKIARSDQIRNVAVWCRGEFQHGRRGAFAIAVSSATGSRYLVLESDGTVFELAGFTGKPDLSCYTPSDANTLNATIGRSETIRGEVVPAFPTTVVCGFVEATSAVCWQYSPRARAFVKVGEWQT